MSWDQFGRPTCGPCRGYDGCLEPDGCSGALVDELLWELCGWLWHLGGRTDLETWMPDETMIAGIHPLEPWQCDGCKGWFPADHGCKKEGMVGTRQICETCAQWTRQPPDAGQARSVVGFCGAGAGIRHEASSCQGQDYEPLAEADTDPVPESGGEDG
jgi:hypothetical protein